MCGLIVLNEYNACVAHALAMHAERQRIESEVVRSSCRFRIILFFVFCCCFVCLFCFVLFCF